MNALLLSGFLAVQQPIGFENPEKEALRYLSKAVYYELDLGTKVKHIEKKYTPEPIKKYGPYIGVSIRVITEKRLSYTWTF